MLDASGAADQRCKRKVKAMRQYARRHRWKVVRGVEDVGSGASERPQREELIKAARRRQIDAILVWRLDHWGRSLLDLIGSLQELSTLGVGFVSLGLESPPPSQRQAFGPHRLWNSLPRRNREPAAAHRLQRTTPPSCEQSAPFLA
jgi:Resolvase, N terminal domain